MKVICVEGLANHDSPESCVVVGNHRGEALTGGGVGPVKSRERYEPLPGAEPVEDVRRQHPTERKRKLRGDPARSETRCMRPSTSYGNREILRLAQADGAGARKGNPSRGYRR